MGRWRVPLATFAAVALVLAGSWGWIDHRSAKVSAADRGRLTPDQYAAAVQVVRTESAQSHGKVTAAFATMARSNKTDCNSSRTLLVQVLGLDVNVSPSPGDTGPDQWLVVRANPTDAFPCVVGVSIGKFKAPPGAANLLPGL